MANYEEGYYEQATVGEETTPIVNLYEIGRKIDKKPIVEFGITEDVVKRELMGQYYHTLEAGNQNMDHVSLNFHPINLRYLEWHYGKRSANTGNRTIRHMDGTLRKLRWTIWKKVNNEERHCHGIVSNNLNTIWGKKGLEITQSGKGMTHNADDGYTPTITFEGTIKDIYNHCSLCSWGGGNLNCVGFEHNSFHELSPSGSNPYQEINEFSVFTETIQITVLSTSGETLVDDKESSTPKEFIITFAKGGNVSSDMTFTTTGRIKQITRNEVDGIDPIYTFLIECGEMVITGDDEL